MIACWPADTLPLTVDRILPPPQPARITVKMTAKARGHPRVSGGRTRDAKKLT